MQLKDKDKGVLYSGPLTVMVDEYSASASEIFAAAIQDYKRGIVIGSTSTYGKGTVQRTIPLTPSESFGFGNRPQEDLGTIKLTIQKFYRVNGGATQLKGVAPDVVIPDRYEYSKTREKDNTNSLTWDEINKAEYMPWTSTYSTDAVVNTANEQVQSSTIFSALRSKVQWINQQQDKPVSLNLAKYQAEQKEMKVVYKSLDSLYKLPVELKVKPSETDAAKLAGDKEKTEKNKQFLNRIKNDIYVDETVKVMNNMIRQNNVAVNSHGGDGADATKKN